MLPYGFPITDCPADFAGVDVEVDDADTEVLDPVAFLVLLPVAAAPPAALDLALDVAGAAMALVRSRVRVPNAPSKCSGIIASAAADDGAVPLIAQIIFWLLSELAGIVNANLGFEPEATVRELSIVAFRVGVDTVGMSWSLVVRCDKVMDPSEFAHIITI